MKYSKKLLICLLVVCGCFSAQAFARDIMFLHHSTGEGVYYEGEVPAWISDYNARNGTNYRINERNYPDTPYDWENYPYDYWNLWINGACDSTHPSIECLNTLTQSYDVIVFKHCFPGAAIEADSGNADVSSSTKTLENYKLQYRALRDVMDTYTDTLFIVWTLAPLHQLATNSAEAVRARQFVDWVTTEFLTEDGKQHPNIALFDFWGVVAEDDPGAVLGKVNCLKYEYEASHFSDDSHPNSAANQAAGPKFARTIVTELEKYFGTSGGEDSGDNGTDAGDDSDTGDDGEDDYEDDCPVVMVMGDDNPGVAVLRKLRDKVLAKSVTGRLLIDLYYKEADTIDAVLKASPKLRQVLTSAVHMIP